MFSKQFLVSLSFQQDQSLDLCHMEIAVKQMVAPSFLVQGRRVQQTAKHGMGWMEEKARENDLSLLKILKIKITVFKNVNIKIR